MDATEIKAQERALREFWVSDTGRIYKWKGKAADVISFHHEIAAKRIPGSDYPEDVLMKLGWIKVGSRVYAGDIIDREPTQGQINTMDSLGRLNRLLVRHGDQYKKFTYEAS